MSFEDDERIIQGLQHAVQSGIAMEMARGEAADTQPKHLRLGVNTALADHGALVALLIDKGLFTLDEYQAKRLECWQREKASYEARLSERMGTNITLA